MSSLPPPSSSPSRRRPSGTSDDGTSYDDDDDDDDSWNLMLPQDKLSLWNLIARESRSVSLFCVLAPLMKYSVEIITKAASEYQNETEGSFWKHQVYMMLSVLAGWLLALMPTKIMTGNAPGFFFASGWLLSFVQDMQGTFPNIPLRLCETVLGRLSFRELAVILPVHFVCTISTSMILRLLLPASIASMAMDPIVYAMDNPWIVDLMKEILVNAAFTVSVLVLPQLLSLNHMPRWLSTFFMYPLYSYAVDSSGKGSAFGPNIVYGLLAAAATKGEQQELLMNNLDLCCLVRLVGPMLGGLLGGRIMAVYFPDN